MQFKNKACLDSESNIPVAYGAPEKQKQHQQKPFTKFTIGTGRLLRLLCIALPLGATAQAQASGPLMPVHLKVGGREVLCKTTPLADDGETYVPLEALSALGLEGKPDGKGESAHVTQLTTRHSEDLALARPNGKSMLLLSDVARLVNGHIIRSEVIGRDNRPLAGSKGDTVYVLARITEVRFQNGALRVTTSFPIPYRAHMAPWETAAQSNDKAVHGSEKVAQGLVECFGAEVTSDFHPAPAAPVLGSPGGNGSDKSQFGVAKIRAQQYSIDTARVAVELPTGITLKTLDKITNTSAIILAELTGTEKRMARNSRINRIDRANNSKTAHASSGTASDSSGPGSSQDVGERVSVPQPGNAVSANARSNEKSIAKSGDTNTNNNKSGNKNDVAVSAGLQTPTPPNDDLDTATLPQTAPPRKSGPAVANSGHTSLRSQSPSRGGSVRRNLPIEVNGLTLVPDSDTHVRLDIATTSAAGTFIHYLPGGKLAIDIPNAMLHLPEGMDTDQTLSHPLLNGIHAELLQDTPPLTRITCDTARIVGFTVTNQSNNKVSVDMRLPRNATGALADKVIVVDAGHGGSSTGATAGGFQEKNITLQISLKLRDALEACGAKVVMTRDKDVDVALSDRPNLANDIHADLFVSVHNDSFTSDCRGTSTYFHMSDPSSRALANVVAQTIAGVSGIPSKGALSDGILYNSGLAVLRESRMPAILVEVAYISNTQDRRKLIDQDFQQRVAKAICDGLRTYVEGGTQNGGRHMGMDVQEAPPIPGDTLDNTRTFLKKSEKIGETPVQRNE